VTPAGLRGVVCPVATPLRNGHLDEEAFRRHLSALLPTVAGIVVLGSSGQLALLAPDVAAAAVEVALHECRDRIPVYVGAGDTSTARVALNLSRYSLDGAAGVLICGPYFQQVSDEAFLLEHFLAAAEAAPVPVVLYNIPSAVGYSLSSQLVERLAGDPRIVGIKDSSGDLFLFQRYLGLQNGTFAVMQGREQLLSASAWLGAAGTVSALANVVPTLLGATIAATEAGDRDRSLQLQGSVTEVASLFDYGHWISALMAALSDLGFGSGEVSSPLPVLSAQERRGVAAALRNPAIREFLIRPVEVADE